MQTIERHIVVKERGLTAIDCLSTSIPEISKQKLKQAMRLGAVWLSASKSKPVRLRRAKKVLVQGDEIFVYYDEKILFADIKPAKLIADEGEYSVWNKPSGMYSQGTKWGDHSSIARWVELFGLEKNQIKAKPCFLVHRLDRATNGLILVAHSKKVAAVFSKLFENREIEKHYTAVVRNEFPSNLVLAEITEEIDGRMASSVVLSSSYNSELNQSRLLIKISTGRKHQIRKHLASVCFPVIGDRLYGSYDHCSNMKILPNLMLSATSLRFICPISQVDREYATE